MKKGKTTMRTVFIAATLAFVGIAPAAAQTPTPTPTASPAAAPAAPTDVIRCAPDTRCLTPEMIPIGTPVKFIANGMVVIGSKIHRIGGQLILEPAEDVIVNGHLIVARGPKPLYMAFSGQDLFGWTIPVVLPCSISVTAGWIWTQDFQRLPLSFSDPKTGAPNLLTIPLEPAGKDMCRRSNFSVTAYVSGPPAIVDVKPGRPGI